MIGTGWGRPDAFTGCDAMLRLLTQGKRFILVLVELLYLLPRRKTPIGSLLRLFIFKQRGELVPDYADRQLVERYWRQASRLGV